jgi:methyl-accepting chemotaxis protein
VTRVACVRGDEASLQGLRKKIDAELGDAAPVMVLAFASSKIALLPVLASLEEAYPDAVVAGSSTSGEFTHEGDGSSTISLFALAGDYKVFSGVGTGLSADPETTVRDALAGQPTEVIGYPHRTGIVLLDPLAGHGEEAALLLADHLGDAPLVGGAAGDDLAMAKTWVGVGSRIVSDAVAVVTIFSRVRLGIGVKHGHAPLSKQLTVTRTDGSVVLEIDGRPAWDVWAEATGDHARERGLDVANLTDDQVGAFLLLFEGGLSVGSEYKIRAPLAREGKAIRFATAVPEGTVLRITESTPDRQVASAREAARRARVQLDRKPAGALVFDCICRNLILTERFGGAVAGMSEELGGAPLAGFETYGEIALDVGSLSGFHNTTSVVLAFPEA